MQHKPRAQNANSRICDLLIRKGIVYDGLGGPGRLLDIAVHGDIIREIGQDLGHYRAGQTISAADLAVCPGFIDPHSHTDIELLVNPRAESKIRQGVTTEISGNCGFSPFPLNGTAFREKSVQLRERYGIEISWKGIHGFLKRLENSGMALNYATMVGHGALRNIVGACLDIPVSPVQLIKMKTILGKCLEQGALGLSTGLIYTPGSYARDEELIELCRVAAAAGGIYATHMRDEGDYLMEAVEEAIRIAAASRISLQISHLKLSYPRNWPKVHAVLSRISEVNAQGMEILADRYPYTATSTFLSVFFPPRLKEGSTKEFIERLRDPETEPLLREYLRKQEEKIGSWDTIRICSVMTGKNRHLPGKTVLAAARDSGKAPFEFIRDTLIEEEDQVAMINFSLNEETFKRIIEHPLVVIGSDGWALAPYGKLGINKPHPRSYGTFPRMLGRYVREEKLMSTGRAIEKMTSMTARKFGLDRRGEIRKGYFADIVIFDPRTVIDLSTWEEPHLYPAGIEYVIVNGRIVLRRGEHTGSLPGRILRRRDRYSSP
ncbi:MAG TPA: D-aminoacylase [Syntrophales bacterium]|nr:D-aminoacylase [Syntrophales bacterium]